MNFYSDIPKFWADKIRSVFGHGACIKNVIFLESRKNQVTRLTIERTSYDGTESFDVIAKYYVWGDSRYEFELLRRVHEQGIAVPNPLYCDNHVVIMEPVPGQKLHHPLDLAFCAPLGKWLRDFHERMKQGDEYIIHRDCSLGNFLAVADAKLASAASPKDDSLAGAAKNCRNADEFSAADPAHTNAANIASAPALPASGDAIIIFGLDLEEARPGNPLEDVAQLAACALMGSDGSSEHAAEVLLGYGLDTEDAKLMRSVWQMISDDLRQRAQFRSEMLGKFKHCISVCEKMMP
ncbi:MAG: hypothetical protein K6G50_08920 [bacterium]|nr:hypothetical protein [bacterium]